MSLKEGMPIEFQLETLVKQEGEQESFLYEGMGQIVEMGNWLYLRYIEAETAVPVTFKLSREGKMTHHPQNGTDEPHDLRCRRKRHGHAPDAGRTGWKSKRSPMKCCWSSRKSRLPEKSPYITNSK